MSIAISSLQSKLNATLLLCQLLDVIVVKLSFSIPIVAYFNECIFLSITILLGIVTFKKRSIHKDIVFVFILLGYALFQIIWRNLPWSHILQAIIYIQFVIYFIYFNNLKYEVKIGTIYYVSKLFKFFILPVTLVAIIDIVNPSLIRNLLTSGNEYDRGINGFYLQSLFGSTTGLSQFCLLILFINYIYNSLFSSHKLLNKFQYCLILMLAFFSFSRKEVALVFLFVFFIYHIHTYGRVYIRKLFFPLLLGCGLILIYIMYFFASANETALSDGYVRYKMADYSVEIIQEKFPFGSGVGTFGSQMSVNYPKIYDEFGVGPEITGYNGERGPIYDLFLFTFTAEQGIGIFIYVYIVLSILFKSPFLGITLYKYIRNYIAFCLLVIGFFAPILMNAFGLISFSLLGLISQGCGDNKK